MENEQNKCPGCGGALNPGDKYCRGCGYSIEKTDVRTLPFQALSLMFIAVTALFGFIVYSVVTAKPEPQFVHPQVEGMDPSAMAGLQEFIKTLPTDYAGLVAQGNTNMDHGQYAEAVVCYDRALALQDSSADVYTDLGACYHALGEIDSALVQFEQALRINPNHAVAHFNIGVVYHALGDTARTRQYWDRYLELEPDSPIADTLRAILKAF